jgi:C-terminal processing protease CtpA/Prc
MRLTTAKSLQVAFYAISAFAGGACATSLGVGSGSPRPARADTPYAAVEQLGRVLVEVENEYVDPVNRAKLVDGAIKGMVAELDPHSSYMPPEDFSAFESDTEGQFGGIGIEVEERSDQLVVLAPIEGSPADRAGVRSGDVIVAVDGRDPSSESLDKLVKRLRGAPGSHVKIGVRRRGVADVLPFDLVREVILVPSVASKLLDSRVAYVRVKQFQEHTHDELLETVASCGPVRGGRSPASSSICAPIRAGSSTKRPKSRTSFSIAASSTPRAIAPGSSTKSERDRGAPSRASLASFSSTSSRPALRS